MIVNETELLLTLEASLTDLPRLSDRLSPAHGDRAFPDPLVPYRHGQLLRWRELGEAGKVYTILLLIALQ